MYSPASCADRFLLWVPPRLVAFLAQGMDNRASILCDRRFNEVLLFPFMWSFRRCFGFGKEVDVVGEKDERVSIPNALAFLCSIVGVAWSSCCIGYGWYSTRSAGDGRCVRLFGFLVLERVFSTKHGSANGDAPTDPESDIRGLRGSSYIILSRNSTLMDVEGLRGQVYATSSSTSYYVLPSRNVPFPSR